MALEIWLKDPELDPLALAPDDIFRRHCVIITEGIYSLRDCDPEAPRLIAISFFRRLISSEVSIWPDDGIDLREIDNDNIPKSALKIPISEEQPFAEPYKGKKGNDCAIRAIIIPNIAHLGSCLPPV